MRWTTTSPDGTNTLATWLDDDGTPRFDVSRRGSMLIADGTLGIVRRDAAFRAGLEAAAESEVVTVDAPYRLHHGKRNRGVLRTAQRVVSLSNAEGARLDVVLCVADDGVAFRYVFPEDDPAPHTVIEELTAFPLVGAGQAWIQPTDVAGYTTPAYEALYTNGVALDHRVERPSYNMPALFEVEGSWLLLAESDLDETYVGGHLDNRGRGATYRIVLPQPDEGMGQGAVEPSYRLPWTLPWRVVILGDTAAEVAESDLVNALARPASGDFSWVRPGRVSWSWWSEHDSPRNVERLRAYIDLAADLGWEYSLIDANWNLLPEEAIPELIDHAHRRNVGVFLWYNSGGPHNEVTEQPRDRMFDPAVRQAEMDRLATWAVSGVKVDFFHRDKQAGIALMLDIARDAADRRLMVNFHGCTVPRGWSRTWPNILTMEGVAGAEQYAFRADYPQAAPWHNTVLAFTRNVVGPMDYTPTTFSDQLYPHLTTNGHELALAVVFESGLQHLADSADSYRACPDSVRRLLSAVPAAWDETRVLDGMPGRFVVVARRKSDEWFVAAISGEPNPRRITLGFDMLVRPAQAVVVGDGAVARAFSSNELSVEPADRYDLELAPYGGAVVWLHR